MNQPFFSVIVPIYNRATFINKSINSVLNQTFKNFELICVDDGSTDNSKEIINQILKQDSRVKLITLEKNYGRCIARNKGIETASANWVCFLDSDDIYFNNHLETFFELIKLNPNYNVFATEQLTIEEKKTYSQKIITTKTYILSIHDFIRDNPLQLNQFCYNKNEIRTTFPNENIPTSEDWYFFRNIALKHLILKSNVVTNQLIQHPTRTMNSINSVDFSKWNLYAAELFIRENNLSKKTIEYILSYTYLFCANILLSSKMRKESVYYFKKSLSFPISYFDTLFYKALIKYIMN